MRAMRVPRHTRADHVDGCGAVRVVTTMVFGASCFGGRLLPILSVKPKRKIIASRTSLCSEELSVYGN